MTVREEISRVKRTKKQAKTSYDRMSRYYDLLAGMAEKKYKEKGLEKLRAQEGEIVLEIGYGTGECVKTLAQSVGETGRVYGIDLSDGMLHVAQRKIEAAELSGNVELIVGDGSDLPFENRFFDAIFLSFTLELFDTPEIPVVLAECKRVLSLDGRLCVVAMSKKDKSGFMVRLYEWSHDMFTSYVDCRPIYVQASIEAAGFRVESLTEMTMFGLPVDIVLAKIQDI